jgi:phytoene synthase
MRSLMARRGEEPTLEQDYAHCQAVQRAHGVSYYFATRFFPPETRRAVHALYGFVRYPDQWVDCPDAHSSPESIRAQLDAYERDLIRAVCGEPVSLPPLRAFADVVRRYNNPPALPAGVSGRNADGLDAHALCDLRGAADLHLGQRVGGGRDDVPHSRRDGTGRAAPRGDDGAGDADDELFARCGRGLARGRVYLPQDELQRFGVSETQIADGIVDDRWVALMRFQIDRCRALYAEAEQGIPLLPREAQYPCAAGRHGSTRVS